MRPLVRTPILAAFTFGMVALLSSTRPALAHPELVETDITRLDQIYEISRFRSGAGHDFSYMEPPECGVEIPYFFATDATEPASSMKHYFAPYEGFKGDQTTVPVYAPFDGEIFRVTEEVNTDDASYVNQRVEILSADNSDYLVVFFHINLSDRYPQILNDWPEACWPEGAPGLPEAHQEDDVYYETATVLAGEFLGYADMRTANDFDVAVLYATESGDRYWTSLFDLMPDSIFAEYEARGANRAGMTFSKAEREADPIEEWGGRNDEDWVTLAEPVPEPHFGFLAALGALAWLRRRAG